MINFQKLMIIIKREYLTRVRTKAFIVITILLPIAIFVLLAAPVLFQMMDTDQTYKIAIKDDSNAVYNEMIKIDSTRYIDSGTKTVEELRQEVIDEDIEGFIVINENELQNADSFEMIYGGHGGITLVTDVRDDLRAAVREVRLDRAEASDEILAIFESRPSLNTRTLTAEGTEAESNTFVLSAIGYVMAFIIYFAIFGYGGYVMRSVIEEKTNRIIEVVVSSVKPFELLLGKILGIGALGVTQFLVWIIAAVGFFTFGGPLLAMITGSGNAPDAGEAAAAIPELPDVGIEVGIYFIIFFILGYFLYSAILAAVGSAVDSESDTQQLMLPITLPVILAIIMLPRVATAPDASFSVISSLIPFFSPILMVARIPITDVPFWQIGTSIILMIGTVILSLYLGAKIYSVGILSYGKSANFKELIKWIKRG